MAGKAPSLQKAQIARGWQWLTDASLVRQQFFDLLQVLVAGDRNDPVLAARDVFQLPVRYGPTHANGEHGDVGFSG